MLGFILSTWKAVFDFLLAVRTMSFDQIYSRLIYFPSIFFNVIKWRLMGLNWFNRIDQTVLLGALPFKSQTKMLVEKECVRGVVSLNETFELEHFTNSSKEWSKVGVAHLHINTVDRNPPTLHEITRSLQMIQEHSVNRHSVYVHCKAGRGRSATVAACYLVKVHKMEPSEAVTFLKSKRPQVKLNERHLKALQTFYQQESLKKD